MRFPVTLVLLLCATCIFPTHLQADRVTDHIRRHLLVVYNRNEPDAERLARLYATVRSIPEDHLLELDCPVEETITRSQYNETILEPIEQWAQRRGWLERRPQALQIMGLNYRTEMALANGLRAIVLIRGIPLRIAEDPSVSVPEEIPQLIRFNRAAVDSELSLITVKGYPLFGFIPNPYHSRDATRRFQGTVCDLLVLVSRLDAPTPADVERMIFHAVEMETIGLQGNAYFDARGMQDTNDGYYVGDLWLRNAAASLRRAGIRTQIDDQPELFAADMPMQDTIFYAGWYSEHPVGPFTRPDFRFRPGAIAYHIHSFSATTLRSHERFWAGPLLHLGATATMGCVYEPYLQYTPHVDIFTSALLQGLTFAEAAYLSQPVLSWQTTVIGDPLYRPFKNLPSR